MVSLHLVCLLFDEHKSVACSGVGFPSCRERSPRRYNHYHRCSVDCMLPTWIGIGGRDHIFERRHRWQPWLLCHDRSELISFNTSNKILLFTLQPSPGLISRARPAASLRLMCWISWPPMLYWSMRSRACEQRTEFCGVGAWVGSK